MRHRRFRATGVLALVVGAAGELFAQSVPSGFSAPVQQGVDLSDGTSMAFTPDGRLFVARSTGEVRVFRNGALLPAAFTRLDVSSVDERGLLGIAIDPGFEVNGFVYVFYTRSSGTMNRLSRFRAAGDVRDPAIPEEVLLELDTSGLSSGVHNGGGLQFGLDGMLYVSVGDGFRAGLSQDPRSLHGKILRLHPDGSIPADNPTTFQGTSIVLPAPSAVWAIGLRNVFTFAVHPGTGRLFLNDVGEDEWEEINDGLRGRNYGWAGGRTDGRRDSPAYTDPIFEYPHAPGPAPVGNVITGGAFYAPAIVQFPASYLGTYFFSDAGVGNFIYALDPATRRADAFLTEGNNPVDVDIGPDGSLYYLARGGAHPGVYRIAYAGLAVQSLIVSTTALSVLEGSTGTFRVRCSMEPGAAPVVVGVERTLGDASVTASPSTLTFTSADWNLDRTVVVTAAQDADPSHDGASVVLSAPGLTSRSIVVTAVDDDPPATAPVPHLALPLNGQVVRGASEEFYGHGVDDSGTTTEAQFFVDGVLVHTDPNLLGHYHVGGGHAGWDTRGLSDGPHVLQFRVSDGTTAGIHEITVVVSNATDAAGTGTGGCGLMGAEFLVLLALRRIGRKVNRADRRPKDRTGE